MLKITQQIQARFEKLDFLLRPYMKYFQLNVNLLLYHHRLTPHTCFFRSSSKILKTLYLTSVERIKRMSNLIEQPWHGASSLSQNYNTVKTSPDTSKRIVKNISKNIFVNYTIYYKQNKQFIPAQCSITILIKPFS